MEIVLELEKLNFLLFYNYLLLIFNCLGKILSIFT